MGRPSNIWLPPAEWPEARLESEIQDYCTKLKLLRYHTHRSDRSEAGWPDDVIIVGDLLCVWELKRQNKGPSEAQDKWLEALRGVKRIDVRVVRPLDLDLVVNILTGKVKP